MNVYCLFYYGFYFQLFHILHDHNYSIDQEEVIKKQKVMDHALKHAHKKIKYLKTSLKRQKMKNLRLEQLLRIINSRDQRLPQNLYTGKKYDNN